MDSSYYLDADIRAVPEWPDPTSGPPLVTRIEHTPSCPEDSSPSPHASNGDASSLPTPAKGTPVAQVVTACNTSAANTVVMPAFTPTSAEKAPLSCDSLDAKTTEDTDTSCPPPLRLHYAMMLVLALGQLLGKLGLAIYFTLGFDPGSAAPSTVPGPFKLLHTT
jgi:hypothetical protein